LYLVLQIGVINGVYVIGYLIEEVKKMKCKRCNKYFRKKRSLHIHEGRVHGYLFKDLPKTAIALASVGIALAIGGIIIRALQTIEFDFAKYNIDDLAIHWKEMIEQVIGEEIEDCFLLKDKG